MNETLKNAHKFCTNHREALSRDTICGCFHCLRIYSPSEITKWLCDNTGTALCPHCGVDAVLGESSGYPITKEFLTEMHAAWFGILTGAEK